MESDATYFARRANEEREAAMKAVQLIARQIHIDMAGRYDELAGAIAMREQELGIRVAAAS